MLRSQKKAYQKSGHSHFAYSNKREMAIIVYEINIICCFSCHCLVTTLKAVTVP